MGFASIDNGAIHLTGTDGSPEVSVDMWLDRGASCLHVGVTNLSSAEAFDRVYLQSGYYQRALETVEEALTEAILAEMNKP